MRILITGASGLLGTSLSRHWLEAGHEVLALSRGGAGREHHWDPESGEVQTSGPLDAVVHLSGENVAAGRWSEAQKERLMRSRVRSTQVISEYLAKREQKPAVMLVASGISYYGDTGDQVVDETSGSGSLFLSELCRQWEGASQAAEDAGIRVVRVRLGMVLSADGGALVKMLPAFKLGLGGVMGTGDQWMSWITLEDVVGLFGMMLEDEQFRGAVNLVSPEPVTNRQFTRCLGGVLHRPTWLPMPSFLAKWLFGQMGEELLLASSRVKPAKVISSGYVYRHADLQSALEEVLGPGA